MATTFNLELNDRPTRKGTYKIMLRITQNRKHKRVSTSIEVKNPRDFNLKAKYGFWIRSSVPQHKIWNEALVNEIELASKTYRDLKVKGNASSEIIKATLRDSEISPSFLNYARARTNEILNEGGYRNYKKYNGFCNKLESYLKSVKKKDLLFVEVTSSFLSKFEAYLNSLNNTRNPEARLHPNTIAINLNIFKTIINRAVSVDKLITPEQNPFLGYQYTREISTTKEKLNQAEITSIEQLDIKSGTVLWHCRNYFLFSFYMAGIRAGDLMQLRWCNITNEGRLEYRMAKTKKDRSILLHEKAMAILRHYYSEDSKPTDYIFPLLDNKARYANAVTPEQIATLNTENIIHLKDDIGKKNALINKYLKKIAEMAGIQKNISMHIARHSFAKIAKDQKVDNNHLKNLLGHSNIKVTETYMGNFDTEETDKVMASIFTREEQPKEKIIALLNKMDPEEIKELLKSMPQ